MNTITCKQLEKYKDKSGKILGYRLADTNGNQIQMQAEELKTKIKAEVLNVVNLTLTKDGRLVDGAQKKEDRKKSKDDREMECRTMKDIRKQYIQEQMEKQEILKEIDTIAENEPDIEVVYDGVLAEVRGRNNSILGYVALDKNHQQYEQGDQINFYLPKELRRIIAENPGSIQNAAIGPNGHVMVHYADKTKAKEIQQILSEQVIQNIPRLNPVKLSERWFDIQEMEDSELEEEYSDLIEIAKYVTKFKMFPIGAADLYELILEAQDLVSTIVMKLCQEFNIKKLYDNYKSTQICEQIYKQGYTIQSQLLISSILWDRDIGALKKVYNYETYKEVMTNKDRKKLLQFMDTVKKEDCDKGKGAFSWFIKVGLYEGQEYKIYKGEKVNMYIETLMRLGIVNNAHEVVDIYSLTKNGQYSRMQTDDLAHTARTICRLLDVIYFNGRTCQIVNESVFCGMPSYFIRLFVEEHLKDLTEGNVFKTLRKLVVPAWYDGCYKIDVHQSCGDELATSYVVNSRDQIIDAIIYGYEIDLEMITDITNGEKEQVVKFIEDMFDSPCTHIKYIIQGKRF